jgi:hypothetical protein
MRGPSAWSIGERELMAAMAAQWNACGFCRDMLGAAAAGHLGRAAVDAVLCDYRSAPISDGLKMTLKFLEIMTLRPRDMTEQRVNAVLDSGISIETLIDAIEVGVVTAEAITIVKADVLKNQGIVNVEQALETLTNNVPAINITSTVGSFSGGGAYANLRGIGQSRTLLLLDGQRLADNATNGNAVDLSGIPCCPGRS